MAEISELIEQLVDDTCAHCDGEKWVDAEEGDNSEPTDSAFFYGLLNGRWS